MKKSRWKPKERLTPEEVRDFILSLERFDPTGAQGKYAPYIVDQLAKGRLVIDPDNDEDGMDMLQALTFFHNNSKKPTWPGHKNIQDYSGKRSSWKELEALADKHGGKKVRRALSEIDEGAELVWEYQLPHKTPGYIYRVYRILEPEIVAKMGQGTKWCTRWVKEKGDTGYGSDKSEITYPESHPRAGETRPLQEVTVEGKTGLPYQAAYYLEKDGPFYMVFRQDPEGVESDDLGPSGQVLQFNHNPEQLMGITDSNLHVVNPPTDMMVAHWSANDPNAPHDAIKQIRNKCKTNYSFTYPEWHERAGEFEERLPIQ